MLAQRLADARQREQDAQRQLADVRDLQRAGGSDDEHDPDGVPISFEWAKAEAVFQEARAHRVACELALKDAETGSYGHCVQCGNAIDVRRLRIRPETQLCITCAREREARRRL